MCRIRCFYLDSVGSGVFAWIRSDPVCLPGSGFSNFFESVTSFSTRIPDPRHKSLQKENIFIKGKTSKNMIENCQKRNLLENPDFFPGSGCGSGLEKIIDPNPPYKYQTGRETLIRAMKYC